ncbi:hypothetical protein BDZ45DRAFT_735683 [Acephala macrosclerotiorum]|nr:hypothetical protein BDZ45DRAFT_735683 [Acephala macrosclerotiorum]
MACFLKRILDYQKPEKLISHGALTLALTRILVVIENKCKGPFGTLSESRVWFDIDTFRGGYIDQNGKRRNRDGTLFKFDQNEEKHAKKREAGQKPHSQEVRQPLQQNEKRTGRKKRKIVASKKQHPRRALAIIEAPEPFCLSFCDTTPYQVLAILDSLSFPSTDTLSIDRWIIVGKTLAFEVEYGYRDSTQHNFLIFRHSVAYIADNENSVPFPTMIEAKQTPNLAMHITQD